MKIHLLVHNSEIATPSHLICIISIYDLREIGKGWLALSELLLYLVEHKSVLLSKVTVHHGNT